MNYSPQKHATFMRNGNAQSSGRNALQQRARRDSSCAIRHCAGAVRALRARILRMHRQRGNTDPVYATWTRNQDAIHNASANQRRGSLHVRSIVKCEASASAASVAASCLYELSV